MVNYFQNAIPSQIALIHTARMQADSGMEGANGLSNLKTLAYTSRCVPLSPYPFLSTSTSYSDSSLVESKGNVKCQESELEEVVSTLAVEQSRDETSSQNLEGSAEKSGGSQKSSGSKDSKRAKQHNAHRSRVRKLQYIAHLERTVQILKAEGSEVSAELEFIEQQNIILNMENRALRQRLESISQEQIIKHWEQGVLEREIGRLQTLYHLQKQQQMQLQHQQPHNQHSKQRRNRSRDLDHQSNSSTKNKDKDASSSKSSVTGSVRV
ncbi:UNVERIFIED_CONTAM: Basic leucine zipper 19 [Sesamum radiatum]|uniref:Basic leucine zipper 19 n=1 Tax=Sesamum radiatum TaxID=300843 RepID=A0AAW2M5H9_SESRA